MGLGSFKWDPYCIPIEFLLDPYWIPIGLLDGFLAGWMACWLAGARFFSATLEQNARMYHFCCYLQHLRSYICKRRGSERGRYHHLPLFTSKNSLVETEGTIRGRTNRTVKPQPRDSLLLALTHSFASHARTNETKPISRLYHPPTSDTLIREHLNHMT